MKKIFGLLFLIGYTLFVKITFAQDSPYYEPPSERKLRNNEIALPNLKTEKIFWYFGANGGMKITGQKLSDNLIGEVESKMKANPYWEAYFGINHDDRWQTEIGFLQNPMALEWQLYSQDTRGPILFRVNKNENILVFRFKKRAITLDKVTKNSRLNITAGLHYAPFRKNESLADYSLRLPTSFSPNGGFQDTLFVKSNFNQKASPISAEIGLELISRLGNPIEIGLFAKYMQSASGLIHTDILIDSHLGEPRKAKLFLNGSDLMMGITLRWNFLNGIRYLPEID